MRPNVQYASLAMIALISAGTACAFESTATAGRVPFPVIVGPIEQIGASTVARGETGLKFDSKIDRTFTASSSTSGNTTTTRVTNAQTGEGKLDADIRRAAAGTTDRLVRIDQIRVNSYSGFFYSTAWINSRVRIKGHVAHEIPSMRPSPGSTGIREVATPAQNPKHTTDDIRHPWESQ